MLSFFICNIKNKEPMCKYLFLLLLLFASTSFAGPAEKKCDEQPSKAQVEACYQVLVVENQEALEEYYDAIMDSSNIPAKVKSQVSAEYQAFMKNIRSMCPDNACVSGAMMEQIKDMYNQTRQYVIPQ